MSTREKLNGRCVCVSFKNEVDSILNKNQDRLWLKHRYDEYKHYFCYDKDHKISSRDTLYFGRTISIKNLEFVSKLMPSLKILQLDPLDQVYREDYDENGDDGYNEELPDYRDEKDRAVPITKIFPQVTCLILPGDTEEDNFVGHLSQVKHLTLLHSPEESPTFPNLDSLEVRTWSSSYADYYNTSVLRSSKRFVVPNVELECSTLPKTLEIIDTDLDFDEYISVGKPHFENLKILKGLCEGRNVETLMNFLKDHKGSLTELSFSVGEHVGNIKVLLPLLTRLQKLSVKIETEKQAIELKEIKTLAYNLQCFELSFSIFSFGAEKRLGPILENLPTGLDNFSIEHVDKFGSYKEIDTFMEKILEKVVNGDTKRVTIVGIGGAFGNPDYTIKKIIDISPSPVRVEKTNTRVFEYRYDSPGNRTEHFQSICDIVISL